MKFVGLRITPSLKAEIERAAANKSVGFAEWIRDAIRMRLMKSQSKTKF